MAHPGGSDYYDVIVIGGGVMGSAAAYQSAKRGLKTLLLEQFDFLHHLGSSHGESRTIRATYPEDYYTSMAMQASRLWEEAESEAGYKVYTKTHQLDVGPATSASLKAVISSCQKKSLLCRVLDNAKLGHELSGRVRIPENWIAVKTELGGVIKPTKAVSMFQSLAFRNGAILKDYMEVVDIRKDEGNGGDGGVRVLIRKGEVFRGRKCVVTTGAWTKKLIQKVGGIDLPIRPLETTVCYWKIKEGYEGDYAIRGDFPTFASYGNPYIYGTPCLEYPGLIKVAVHGGCPCDPNKRPWSQTPQLEPLREWIEGRFQGRVDSSGPVHTQSCIYSMTPDEDYVIDFLGGVFEKDVVVGGGFSGHGFKMAPLIGKILVDMVLHGKAEGVEIEKFSIGRFQLNPKGNVKNYEDQVGVSICN